MRILLVDGDADLLQARRQAFWKSHRHWEVLLAQTGGEALQLLSRDPVDIVIVDLHLADLEASELVQRLRETHPGVVRIALAEPAPSEWMEQAEEQFHRVFLKPLEASFLIDAVESLNIEDDETNVRAIRAFVAGLGRIPSLPSLYTELVTLLEREDTGVGEVARLVRQDLGVASQVLKLANSVHFASSRPVSEIGQAIARVGMDSLRALVLFRGLLSTFDTRLPQGLDLEKLWFHSFQVATGVRRLTILEGQTGLADMAFSVGLLHDVGLVVLATDPSHRYAAVLERAQLGRIPLTVLEHETYGVDHAQVGAHLLSLWGLPSSFCRPIREHHAPPPSTGAGFSLSAALHLSDARHGGGAAAGFFADGRWGLHPSVMADGERFARWKTCLAEGGAEAGA
jgi:HD-like signal output (HDOD) protein/CheY-like chemotaxis protein